MSTGQRRHRLHPVCVTCRADAESVIAYPNGEALPHCNDCSTSELTNNKLGREYPTEEFYPPSGTETHEFAPPDGKFDLYNPDDSYSQWVSADNVAASNSSVLLEEMI